MRGRKRSLSVGVVLATALAVAGCAVSPKPTSEAEREARVERDLKSLFGAPVTADQPLTLYRVQALALKHNVDRRQKMLEETLAQKLNSALGFSMLPQLTARAGYTARSNDEGYASYTPATGTLADASVSSDRRRTNESLLVAWNVLDFGLSYLRARQAADSILIAQERRRKVVQTILNDVKSAYWRALNEQQTGPLVDSLIARVDAVWTKLETDKSIRWASPAQELEYRKLLLGQMQYLQRLRRDMMSGRLDLAALLNVDFQKPLTLAPPIGFNQSAQFLALDLATLERTALANRPELREADYQERISADETRKAMVQMLPGIDLSGGYNHDANSHLLHHHWFESGLKLTWNLMNLVSGPFNIATYETQEKMGEMRRLSTSMAVIGQVNVAARRLQLANVDYNLASRLAEVESGLFTHSVAAQVSDAEAIRRQSVVLDARYRRDLALIEVEGAAGALAISIGQDPVPEAADLDNVDELARLVEAAANRNAVSRPAVFSPPPATPPAVPSGAETLPPAPPVAAAQPVAPRPAPPGWLPTRLSPAAGRLAQDPVLQRFVVLQELAENGDISHEEYAARRDANLSTLLPYSSGRPFAGRAEAPPATVDLRRRLALANQLREDSQARQRAVALDSLMPLQQPMASLPLPRQDGARERALALAAAGLISIEEMQREVTALDKAANAPRPARTGKVPPAVANRPWVNR